MLNYKSTLVQLLGLSPEATDDEIMQNADTAVQGMEQLQRKLANCGRAREQLQNAHDELKKKHETLLNAAVERDMEAYKSVIGEEDDSKEIWKNDLMANREATLTKLEALSKRMTPRGAKKPLHNAATAKTPGPSTAEVDPNVAQAVLVKNRALQMLKNKECASWNIAWNRAQAEVVVN